MKNKVKKQVTITLDDLAHEIALLYMYKKLGVYTEELHTYMQYGLQTIFDQEFYNQAEAMATQVVETIDVEQLKKRINDGK